jgi:hypothetical protein
VWGLYVRCFRFSPGHRHPAARALQALSDALSVPRGLNPFLGFDLAIRNAGRPGFLSCSARFARAHHSGQRVPPVYSLSWLYSRAILPPKASEHIFVSLDGRLPLPQLTTPGVAEYSTVYENECVREATQGGGGGVASAPGGCICSYPGTLLSLIGSHNGMDEIQDGDLLVLPALNLLCCRRIGWMAWGFASSDRKLMCYATRPLLLVKYD